MLKQWDGIYTRLSSMKKKELVEWATLQHPKELTQEENKNLPLPRLEARAYKLDIVENQYHFVVIYCLIRLNINNKIECSPISFTKIGVQDQMDLLELPWRMEGDMLNDMFELKLPAYFVKPNVIKQLSLQDEDILPLGLKAKIKERNNKLN